MIPELRELHHAMSVDAASDRVDQTAAEVAALVARASAPVIAARVHRHAASAYQPLQFVLDGYGVTLRMRLQADESSLLVLEPKRDRGSEFEGVTVSEAAPARTA